jgi:hypothetical protein
MEITCKRCHQTVQAENCYCSVCGLPQLIYTTDGVPGQTSPEQWSEAVRDAATIEWKPALRAALIVAVPAGILVPLLGFFGLFWIGAASTWAVSLYLRNQRPAWITTGAGARIGLVTGLLAGWLAFGVSGGQLFVQRFLLHHGSQIDTNWKSYVEASQQLTLQMGLGDAVQMQVQKAWMLSPEGHAGFAIGGFIFNTAFLLLFAVAGGALGARFLARTRQPEI